jgi:ketosteroid isomerase-like protein
MLMRQCHQLECSLNRAMEPQMNVVRDTTNLRKTADAFIAATNSCDVDAVLKLFAPDAVIDDPSTGHCFDGHTGIRAYIEQFFVGYHTVTRFLSLESLSADLARVRVDFTGDFGHEIGLLDMSVDAAGMIVRINASLE